MSDINAAHLACMQHLTREGQAVNQINEECGGDGDGDGDVDVAEQLFKQYRENRQQRKEEDKRMQKVWGGGEG
jgi:hypothetical protein